MKDGEKPSRFRDASTPRSVNAGSGPQISNASPPDIPDHELLRCIGSGSYGEVWLARNVLGKGRAVKIVCREVFDNDRPYEREYQGIEKFEPISRSHESQLDILHVGRNEEQGYFYYVMELADADDPNHPVFDPSKEDNYAPRTLKSDLRRRERLPFPECLRISLALTTALEHLHAHDLIHRDIKPANVIFIHGQPKLADIGLVAETGKTLSMVGTEGYLPPEGPGSKSADLFSLGRPSTNVPREWTGWPFRPCRRTSGSCPRKRPCLNSMKSWSRLVIPRLQNAIKAPRRCIGDMAWLESGKSIRRKFQVVQSLRWLQKGGSRCRRDPVDRVSRRTLWPPLQPPKPSPPKLSKIPVGMDLQDINPSFHRRFHDIDAEGKRLVYVDFKGRPQLYENDFLRPLFESQSEDWHFYAIKWSPDSQKLALAGYRRSSPGQPRRNSVFIGELTPETLEQIPVEYPGRNLVLIWRPENSGLTLRTIRPDHSFDLDWDGTQHPWTALEEPIPFRPGAGYSPSGQWICPTIRTTSG